MVSEDSEVLQKCSNGTRADYDAVGIWFNIVITKSDWDNAGYSHLSQCTRVLRAQRAIPVAETASRYSLTRRYAKTYYSGVISTDDPHIANLLGRLEQSAGLARYPLDSSTDDDDKQFVETARNYYYRMAAVNPSECSPPPQSLRASVLGAGPGPSLVQTDAWLIDNLPTSYFAITHLAVVVESARYDVEDCSIGVTIDSKQTHPTSYVALATEPLYVIEVQAASLSSQGSQVFFGEYGHGSVNFQDVRPASIVVKPDDMSSNSLPLGLGYKEWDLAFRDPDLAQRMASALQRLAKLCGARGDPF